MQFKKSAVVGVLITLCLSTDSWCFYIPEKKTTIATKENETSLNSEKIRICGSALTSFIIEFCGGFLNQANSTGENPQSQITDDCCEQECSSDYFNSYCEKTPLFTINFSKILQRKLLTKLSRNRPFGSRTTQTPMYRSMKKGVSEVRVREKKLGNRKWEKSRKKKKRLFKRKCTYKSFGHYLLKLERGHRARNNTAKEPNTINRTWPSIQIGTVSPEIDKFGGQPIIVVKKNKSNSI